MYQKLELGRKVSCIIYYRSCDVMKLFYLKNDFFVLLIRTQLAEAHQDTKNIQVYMLTDQGDKILDTEMLEALVASFQVRSLSKYERICIGYPSYVS